ncbi:hypothetical protein vseg_019703 [Gypsophila vaccaria]
MKAIPNASPDQIISHVTRDWLLNTITIFDEDLPPFGPNHNIDLYINAGYRKKTMPVVLIDNGSAVNVLPITTAKKIGLSVADFIPCNKGLRAFDAVAEV